MPLSGALWVGPVSLSDLLNSRSPPSVDNAWVRRLSELSGLRCNVSPPSEHVRMLCWASARSFVESSKWSVILSSAQSLGQPYRCAIASDAL